MALEASELNGLLNNSIPDWFYSSGHRSLLRGPPAAGAPAIDPLGRINYQVDCDRVCAHGPVDLQVQSTLRQDGLHYLSRPVSSSGSASLSVSHRAIESFSIRFCIITEDRNRAANNLIPAHYRGPSAQVGSPPPLKMKNCLACNI